MADKDEKDTKVAPTATPRLEVKVVQLGGESILDRLLPHMKKIAWTLAVSVGVLAIIFFVLWLRDRKHAKDTEKLAAVLEVAERPVRPADDKPDPKKPAPPSFADSKERANAVLDALVKQGTDAAGPGYRASMLVQAGKLDEAIGEYRKAQGQTGLDGVLAREGLGIALEMKATQDKDAAARQKGLEEALATFKSMQPDEKGPRAAYALYHQGRIFVLLGKRDEAKGVFEKAKELGKNTDLAELVDERLASLGAS